MKCYHISITVKNDSRGFCFAVMESSFKHQINGYVQRVADNEFLIEAEGQDENLEKFIAWFDNRLQWTKIKNKIIQEIKLNDYKTFDIIDVRNVTNYQHEGVNQKKVRVITNRFDSPVAKKL